MAIPDDRDMLQLGPWPAGANNLALETSVPRRSFRRGVNVDVTDDGKVVRREGRAQVIDIAEPRALFGYGPRGFFVSGQTLYGFEVVNGQETGPIELFQGLAPDARIAHCLVDPDLYVSDGATSLRVSASNDVAPWSVPAAQAPALAAAADGSLAKGTYFVAVAYKAPTGEEGPLSLSAKIEVQDEQRIAVTLPAPPSGMRTAVYMTKPNGTQLLHLATVPAVGVLNINKQPLGRPSATEDMDPMPPGNFAALWNGRLLTGADRFVYWSQPMHYGLTQAAYNYMEFAEPITMLAASETAPGFFVGQRSRTYFVAGEDPADSRLKEAYPFGVIPGTLQMVPGSRLPFDESPSEPVPMWMADNGVFCVGFPDGQVVPLTESRYAAYKAPEGAALFDQRAGKNRYVASLRDPSENNFALSDAFTAEVVRNDN